MNTHAVLALLFLLPACQAVTPEGKGIGVVLVHGRGADNPTGGGNDEP